MASALIIVDVQYDFLDGGALAVPHSTEILKPIIDLAGLVDLVVATRDWHPDNHISFKMWPKHCVKNSYGAQLHYRIDRLADVIISKGTSVLKEAYSGFSNPSLAKILEGYDKVLISGLATDFCVMATALDARSTWADLSKEIIVPLEACRGIDESNTKQAIKAMEKAGIKCVED